MKLKTLLFVASSFILNYSYSQEEEAEVFTKSNEIGVMGGVGFNKLSGLNIYAGGAKNTIASAGVFYGRTFVPRVKMRLGLNLNFMFSSNEFENGYSDYRSMHMEVPLQFHFTINPQHRVQGYVGLGISINRWMNTQVKNELNGVESTAKTYNPKRGMQLAPVILAGVNVKLNEEFSLFLQPEYRPVALQKQTNTRLNSVVVFLGMIYHL